jgi:hypothetical protein
MSDEQTLLAVIAVIYLADCIYWIPGSGLSITSWFGLPWKLRYPSSLLGNQRGAIGLANPLPPLGLATRCQGLTVSIAPEGILSCVSAEIAPGRRPPQTANAFRWSEIKSVQREERTVLINNEFFYKASSEYSSRHLASEIARLSKLDDKKRSTEIANLISDSCDPAAINDRVTAFLKQSRHLRYLANVLFLFLFGICPFVVWRYGLAATLWPIVGGLYTQTIIIALLFSKAHRKVYPHDSSQIFKPFLTMLLAAPSAIRVQDILGRPLLEPFHPLAVAKTLCSAKDFKNLATHAIRDLNFPRLPIPQTSIERTFRDAVLATLTRKLQISDAEILTAPQRSETVHTRYCPRCHQQFTDAATYCRDCGGRELLAL